MTVTIDDLIVEYLSFAAFKDGKAPLNGADRSKRIAKRIWRNEGLDITSLLGGDPDPGAGSVLEVMEMKLSMGFLRGKKERSIAVGLKDASALVESAARGGSLIEIVRRSRLLMPPFASAAASDVMTVSKMIGVRSVSQSAPGPFEPSSLGRMEASRDAISDLSFNLDKKAAKDHELVLKSGRRIGTFRALIQGILEMSDPELSDLLGSGKLSDFARRGLSSPAIESIITEIGHRDSAPEEPSVARERFMLWVLEGPSGVTVVREIAEPMMRKLVSCSAQEARRLSEVLQPLTDERSASVLIEMLFKVPAQNRLAVIRLLGKTGSNLAIAPLTKLKELSSVESDRTEADSALRRLGVGVRP